MTRSNRRTLIGTLGVALLVGACSSSGSSTATPAGGGGGAAGTPAPGGNGGAGNVSSIDACSLLTPDEIKAALGVDMKAGVPQTTDNQVECEWDSQKDSDAVGVSVSVATYDDALWKTLSSAGNAKPISGFGEAAFTGVPHAGDISIKQGGYEIDLGIVDFTLDNAKVGASAQSLAKLVLSRL